MKFKDLIESTNPALKKLLFMTTKRFEPEEGHLNFVNVGTMLLFERTTKVETHSGKVDLVKFQVWNREKVEHPLYVDRALFMKVTVPLGKKDDVLKAILIATKGASESTSGRKQIQLSLDGLKQCGIDWPEIAMIEKSINS